MLDKRHKIASRSRVSHILAKGSKKNFRLFFVRFLPNRASCNRFAVSVSAKVMATAVGRNKIRRQIYEAIRVQIKEGFTATTHTQSTPLPQSSKPCYDVVVLASKQISTASFSDIQNDITNLIHTFSTL